MLFRSHENVVRTSSESPHCQAEKRRMLEVLGAKSPPGRLPGQAPRDSVSPPMALSSLRRKREKTESQAPFQAVAGARCPRWELVPLNLNDPPGQLLGQERVPGVDWQGCVEAAPHQGDRQFDPCRHVRHTGPGSHCGGRGGSRCPGESAGVPPGRRRPFWLSGTVSQSPRRALSQWPLPVAPEGPSPPMRDCASPDLPPAPRTPSHTQRQQHGSFCSLRSAHKAPPALPERDTPGRGHLSHVRLHPGLQLRGSDRLLCTTQANHRG